MNLFSYNYQSPSLYDPSEDLAKYGRSQIADLSDYYKAAMGQGVQDMVSRGLSGTTLLPSVRMGYARQRSRAMQNLQESLARMRIGVGMQQNQQNLQASQFGANLGLQYAQLAQQANQFNQQQARYQQPEQIAATGYVDLGGGGYYPGSYGSPTQMYYRQLLS